MSRAPWMLDRSESIDRVRMAAKRREDKREATVYWVAQGHGDISHAGTLWQ